MSHLSNTHNVASLSPAAAAATISFALSNLNELQKDPRILMCQPPVMATRTAAAAVLLWLILAIGSGRTGSNALAIDDVAMEEAALALLATDAQREIQEADMRAFVGLESVAAIESYSTETRKCASWLKDWLKDRLNMEDAGLYESGYRHPVVVASTSSDRSKPAIVVYGHYDVQPVDGEWSISDPFELKRKTIEGYGEVFTGRGSQDCKGTLYSALSALSALNEVLEGGLASLPVRIIVAVEGEEEIGSPGFGKVLRENSQLFDGTEVVFSTDGPQPALDHGSLVLSTRGLFGVQIDCFGAGMDAKRRSRCASSGLPLSAVAPPRGLSLQAAMASAAARRAAWREPLVHTRTMPAMN